MIGVIPDKPGRKRPGQFKESMFAQRPQLTAQGRVATLEDRARQFLLERAHPALDPKYAPDESLFPFPIWVTVEPCRMERGCDCELVYRLTPESAEAVAEHFGVPRARSTSNRHSVCDCNGRFIE